MLQARKLAGRDFSDAIHGTTQGFSVAGKDLEAGRADAANKTPNRFLVDNIAAAADASASAGLRNSEARRPQRGSPALYKRNDWRTERCGRQPPQRRRKRVAIPAAARRTTNRRNPRFSALLSHLRIDCHTLVSAH